jgi:comEA protein
MSRLARRQWALSLTLVLVCTAVLATGVYAAQDPEPVNINTASVEELQALPRIGPAVAERIVAYRDKYGPFTRTAEIMTVKGIGEKTFASLKDLITVGEGPEK